MFGFGLVVGLGFGLGWGLVGFGLVRLAWLGAWGFWF